MSGHGDVPDAKPFGVILCDDHHVLGDALAMLFDTDPDLELVAPPARDPHQAIELAGSKHPAVVLMDVDLGTDIDGIEAARRIKKADGRVQVVLMTAMTDEELLVKAVEAGAAGLLRKTIPAQELIDSIKAVAKGESLVDGAQLTRVLQKVAGRRQAEAGERVRIDQLTAREMEILQLLGEGRRPDEIADRLSLSIHTVNTHVRNLLAKLGVSSKLEAVVLAARHDVISVGGKKRG